MKLSTRGRYGIRLLIDLAEHVSEPQVTLASVAERQAISMRYLEQIAVLLKRTGYIRSIKGASGGYALALDPLKIHIGDVLRVLEGDLYVVDDLRPDEMENAFQRCLRAMVYDKLNQSIAQVVDSLTLDQMAGTIDPDSAYMYYI